MNYRLTRAQRRARQKEAAEVLYAAKAVEKSIFLYTHTPLESKLKIAAMVILGLVAACACAVLASILYVFLHAALTQQTMTQHAQTEWVRSVGNGRCQLMPACRNAAKRHDQTLIALSQTQASNIRRTEK